MRRERGVQRVIYAKSMRGERAGPCGCFAVRATRSPNPTPAARAHQRAITKAIAGSAVRRRLWRGKAADYLASEHLVDLAMARNHFNHAGDYIAIHVVRRTMADKRSTLFLDSSNEIDALHTHSIMPTERDTGSRSPLLMKSAMSLRSDKSIWRNSSSVCPCVQ